jgi:Zn-dependent M28 family amino/carboxypeptidase
LPDPEIEPLEAALREHVRALTVEIGPRAPSIPGTLPRAASYIRAVLEAAGLLVREQAYDYEGQRVTNLLATEPSRSGASSYYLVGAHYDTVPTTPGADDNASAVAVMVELARRMAKMKPVAPIVFAAFTLEEPPASNTGHQGSRRFVAEARVQGDRVLGAIILEMVGYTAPRQVYPFLPRWPGYPAQGNFIGLICNWRSLTFGRAVRRSFRENARLPVSSLFLPFNGWLIPETRWSDHAPFWDARLPALMVTDTAFFRNPHYHLPSDTIDTLDFRFMAKLVSSLELALRELV